MNNNNINKSKVYYNPFNKQNHNPNKKYQNNRNRNNRNRNNRNQNNRNDNGNNRNDNRRNKNYNQYNEWNKGYETPVNRNPNKKYNNPFQGIFPSHPIFDNIQSIEIIPITDTNQTSQHSELNLENSKTIEPSSDLFGSFLKKILAKDIKPEKKEEIPSVPEFVVDINKEYEEITKPIKTIDDLIELGLSYDPLTADKYSVNLKRLNKLVEPLTELKNVIGMKSVKESIIDQLVYFLQSFEDNNNMLHTVIEGPPGVGKTMLGYILGKIYYNMGVLKGSDKAYNSLTGKKDDFVFKIVKRKDLIGEYLGHTAVKTQKVIDECKGGVLFIDEAYSLGNIDKKDTYSKECIDTINQNLSENKTNFMCIIAGYPDQLEQCFFSYNEGLRRRFTFKYTIEKYSAKELTNIFIKMINDCTWKLDVPQERLEEFINKNIKEFENFGGDMETLLFRSKLTHSKRVFGIHPRNKKILSMEDIEKGFEVFKENKKRIQKDTISEEVLRNIYT
jgi:SpoVK/Ycf46/Vps4 family AAA+-type ATPase